MCDAMAIARMGAHADDALRLAGLAVDDPMEMRRCRAQATSMARQADATLRTLLRIQAARDKQLAGLQPAAMERAGYWFREITVPAPAPAPSPDQARASPPWPAEPEPTEAGIDAEADRYAVIYPDRAARIRAAGGLPPDLDFGPPAPPVVVGLLRSGDASRTMRHHPVNRDSETEPMPPPGRVRVLAGAHPGGTV